MLKIRYEKSFKQDFKRCKKRGKNVSKLYAVISCLQQGLPLEERYHDHSLKGKYTGYRECHIEPDWLLIYRVDEKEVILLVTRTGTHSDLF